MAIVARKFLYLDTGFLEDTLSAIEGYTYTEASVKDSITQNKEGTITGGIPVISAKGSLGNATTREEEKTVRLNNAAKFQRIFEYFSQQDKDGIPYYEVMNEETWSGTIRHSIFEGSFKLRFSRVESYANIASSFESIAQFINPYLENPLETDRNMQAMIDLGKKERESGLPVVLEFAGGTKFPCIAYLDETFLLVQREKLQGEVTALCKVQRLVQKGDSVELVNLFSIAQSPVLNREQRRKMSSNSRAAKEQIGDAVKGPGFVVYPIAIYQ